MLAVTIFICVFVLLPISLVGLVLAFRQHDRDIQKWIDDA